MLRLKMAESQQAIATEQVRLALIETRLKQIEQEDTMPTYEVVLKQVPAQKVAGVQGVAPNWAELGPTFNHLFDEVIGYLAQSGGKMTGPAIALYHDREYRDHDINVAAAMPTDSDLPGNARVHLHELPAVETMACLIYPGPFTGIEAGYKAMMDWIAANGYQISGPNREVYLAYEREGDPAKYVTELQIPVEKADKK